MTPTGYLAAFPELDEHLFLSSEMAFQASAKYCKREHYTSWHVSSTDFTHFRR